MDKGTEREKGARIGGRRPPVVRCVLCGIGLALLAVHYLTRNSAEASVFLTEKIVHPIHRLLARVTGVLPFSLAEVLLCAAVLGAAVYLISQIVLLILRPERGRHLISVLLTGAAAGLLIWGGMCFLWGGTYYGRSLAERANLSQEKISKEQLAATAQYFADLANEYAGQVPRDENGVCTADKAQVLKDAAHYYDRAEELFPCLAGPHVRVKGLSPWFSKLMSYTGYTGFFFPFTGEADVNTGFPPSLFAATAAHETAHQRGVAREEEANFAAVLACLMCDDPYVRYSGALMGYIYLNNALLGADDKAWEKVYGSLTEPVLADLAANRAYWDRFESPVQEASDKMYDSFLKGYSQELGVKSYGACVDLLVNYYCARGTDPVAQP